VELKERILIVEDVSLMAQVLCRALSLPQSGGYQVETCGSAEAALERLRDTHFDLLIAASHLPDMSGLELIDRVGQLSPDTRSILITESGPQVGEQARRQAGAHIPKLFYLRDIIQAVHHILDEPEAHGQSYLGEEAAGHH
jgi:CheY-like chemotaxis protein